MKKTEINNSIAVNFAEQFIHSIDKSIFVSLFCIVLNLFFMLEHVVRKCLRRKSNYRSEMSTLRKEKVASIIYSRYNLHRLSTWQSFLLWQTTKTCDVFHIIQTIIHVDISKANWGSRKSIRGNWSYSRFTILLLLLSLFTLSSLSLYLPLCI